LAGGELTNYHRHLLRAVEIWRAGAEFGASDPMTAEHIQAYLGHKNIQHTVRYTELAPTRFKDFWR
jgi:hypothetical protein